LNGFLAPFWHARRHGSVRIGGRAAGGPPLGKWPSRVLGEFEEAGVERVMLQSITVHAAF
jgi:hypothetical protein